MDTDESHQLDPGAAFDHARRMGERVEKKGRWHGWMWLTIGVITPIFLIGANANSVPGELQFWIAIGFMVVGAVLAIWEHRRGLWGREAARIDRPFTGAYMLAIVAFAIPTVILDPDGAPVWLVVLALVPSTPCLIAAWRILSR